VSSLGLIAGNGVFPLEVALAARRRGIKLIALAHRGETTPELEAKVDQLTWIKVGELQKIIDVLKNAGVEQAAMAGGISRANLADTFASPTPSRPMSARSKCSPRSHGGATMRCCAPSRAKSNPKEFR
jgi:DUF1009 family protein